jgi:transglutaminase-like putative cysteine protease
MMRRVIRHVRSRLVYDVLEPTWSALQVAVAATPVEERLSITVDGEPLEPRVVPAAHGGRQHTFDLDRGLVVVEYEATVDDGPAAPAATEEDRLTYVRPSRYAESDRLAGFAAVEFDGVPHGPELLAAVASWVGTRLVYVPGSSEPTDGATETLLSGAGVCRDYAHLVVAILRALDVPARLVAVYAPGLSPMDFHAVAEAWVDDAWCVVDSTLLAPRRSLVRISTGRDAADTAFLSTYHGNIDLQQIEVVAYVDGDLPNDDVTVPVSLT